MHKCTTEIKNRNFTKSNCIKSNVWKAHKIQNNESKSKFKQKKCIVRACIQFFYFSSSSLYLSSLRLKQNWCKWKRKKNEKNHIHIPLHF